MAELNVNLSNYDAREGFDPLPPGWYEAEIIDSEIRHGAKGAYINWTFAVVGKPNRIWDVMSLGNEISLQRLKTLATCCGHPNPNYISDTEELHGLKCQIRLKIEHDDTGQYEPKNKVTAFKPTNGKQQPSSPTVINPPNPSAPAPAEPAQKPKMPWD